MPAKLIGTKRPGVPYACHCDKKHPRDLDMTGFVLAVPACPEAYWFWRESRTHCSGCHIARGDGDVPAQDPTPEFARLTADYPEETLTAWYDVQIRAVLDRCDELAQKLTKNWTFLEERKPGLKDPIWDKLWIQEARFIHGYGAGCLTDKVPGMRLDPGIGTIGALNRAGHCLVCPGHGIEGVPAECWPTMDDVEHRRLYNSLSQRGWVTGERPGAWMRMCEECCEGPIGALGLSLSEQFKAIQRRAI